MKKLCIIVMLSPLVLSICQATNGSENFSNRFNIKESARKMRGKALGNLRAKLDRAKLGKTKNRNRSVRRAVPYRHR